MMNEPKVNQTMESANYRNQNPDVRENYIELTLAIVQGASDEYRKNAKIIGKNKALLRDPAYSGDPSKLRAKIKDSKDEMARIELWFTNCTWLTLISPLSGTKIVESLKQNADEIIKAHSQNVETA